MWAEEKKDFLPIDYHTAWSSIWSHILYTHEKALRQLQQGTGSCVEFISLESIPGVFDDIFLNTKDSINLIEASFGSSAANLAKILRVSRPMIYKYRDGMEPKVQNKRRIQELAKIACKWNSIIGRSFESDLNTVQPEGRSLLNFLSDKEIDFIILDRVLLRCHEKYRNDRILREALTEKLEHDEPLENRLDIVRERHAKGSPVFAGDPENPGKLIQLLPDGRRIRGRLVDRNFIPD